MSGLQTVILLVCCVVISTDAFKDPSLYSWINVKSFQLKKTPAGKVSGAILTTDNSDLDELHFDLESHLERYGNHLENSISHCLFEGTVIGSSNNVREDEKSGPARLKYCNQELSGHFRFDGVVYHLHTKQNDGSWILFKVENLDDNGEYFQWVDSMSSSKRSVNEKVIQLDRKRRSSPSSTPQLLEKSFVEIIMIFSYSYYESVEFSNETIFNQALEMVHKSDFYYAGMQDLNIHLALVDVVIWEDDDVIKDSIDIMDALNKFTTWHNENLDVLPNHDFALLVSASRLNSLGVSYEGTMCDRLGSTGLVIEINVSVDLTVRIVTYMIGRVLGLDITPSDPEHPCVCPYNSCAMQRGGNSFITGGFTDCDRQKLRDILLNGAVNCLHNTPEFQVAEAICGDYVVNQDFEQCDCGPEEHCVDPCCDPNSCSLLPGAACSAADLCCDPQTCGVKSRGVVCRSDMNACDAVEVCDGVSVECPSDEYKDNGATCLSFSGSLGHCYQGDCLTIYDQCTRLFNTLETPEREKSQLESSCWRVNKQGSPSGNCGSNIRGNFTACPHDDMVCGKLQCSSILVGTEPDRKRVFNALYAEEAGSEKCFSVDHSSLQGSDTDHAYVRDGTHCAPNSFCYNRRCTRVSEILGLSPCPYNCFGNGLCNWVTGECQCHEGFIAPTCEMEETVPDSGWPIAEILSVTACGISTTALTVAMVLFFYRRGIKQRKELKDELYLKT